MLHWRHTTLEILFVLPQNHGSWKSENGYLCMFLVCTQYLIEGIFTSKLSAWGRLRYILFDKVELQRVTGIHFCIWSIVSPRSIPEIEAMAFFF